MRRNAPPVPLPLLDVVITVMVAVVVAFAYMPNFGRGMRICLTSDSQASIVFACWICERTLK